MTIERLVPGSDLQAFPPAEKWDDWREYDVSQWPRRVEKRYLLVPTVCFNCEAACGLLAYVDKDNLRVRKFEGNPLHPASRGRNCAKGPATINQINDPERILHPLKRAGKRGEGKWARVGWEEALEDIGGRIRRAFQEGRRNEVMYHVGRPGHERAMDRVLKAWGIDGHNSHTNVCSSSARLGYALWSGYDRPSPDHANARFILLLSSHLEAGHYFNPHAQRIIEGKLAGAKLAVMDPRLSNTASQADFWLPTYPGSEAAVLLAMAMVLLDEGLADLAYLERWTNWRDYLADRHPEAEPTFARFLTALREHYRALHAGVRGGRKRSAPREDRGGGAGHRRGARGLRLARLAGNGQRQLRRLAGGASASAPHRAHGQPGDARRDLSPRLEQVEARLLGGAAAARGVERAALPEGMAAQPLRDELPPPALPEGGTGEAGRLLHPGLQPRLDQSRRDHVDGGPAGRVPRGPARRPDPDLERDRDLRGLRAAHGSRGGAARHPEPGDAVRPVGELPPAGAAGRARAAWGRGFSTRARPTPARSGKRTSSGPTSPGRSTPTAASGSAGTSSRRTSRAAS